MDFNIILHGQPATKKNSQVPLVLPNGRAMIVQGKVFKKYERQVLKQIGAWLWTPEQLKALPISEPCHVRAIYYLRDRRSQPDINNLQAATADILQAAGILTNDRLIEHWDGSRRVFYTSHPRVDVYIKVIGAGQCLFDGLPAQGEIIK